MKFDYSRFAFAAAAGYERGVDDGKIVAAAAKVRSALAAYPHFCVVEVPADAKQTFLALAAAAAGNEYILEAPDARNRRVSFTNVRIDEANANAPRKTGTRYSRTNLPMAPHTDSSFRVEPHELVAFHCVEHDESGGDSVLAAVEDVLDQLSPDAVARLREPAFPFGKALRPILSGQPGVEEIRYYRAQLDRPLADGVVSLTATQREALDELDLVLERHDRFHNLPLRSGEVLFMHNRKVLHGRTGFSGESRRHLRRIRLRAPELSAG